MKRFLIALDKILNILLFILLLSTSFVLAQNRITVFKTDNRGFKFYYNPTSAPGYEREWIFGVSSYRDDNYGNYSGDNGTFGYPIFEFKPKPSAGGYLIDLNKNIFRILNYNSTTNLTAIRLGAGTQVDPNSYSRILMIPRLMSVVFDFGNQNSYPTEGQFLLSYLYADIGDLIAVYSCEQDEVSCLGKEGVYKRGTQPPGATWVRNLSGSNDIAVYRNPDYCFGEQNRGGVLKHICLGDCSGDDEALTFCIRTQP